MAEETKKTYTDIEKADAFYDAVMKYKEKIAKTESGLATFEKSGKYKEYDAQEAKAMEALEGLGTLSDVQKDMVAANKEASLEHDAREKLLAQKEKYLESVSVLEGQIKIAISKYIVDTEKEVKKLEEDKEKYAKYVEKEKAEYEELKAKVEAMDKDDVTYEDEVAKLENKKNEIERIDKKLESFGERLTKATDELNKNKEKYKDYIDLATEELTSPEGPESPADHENPEEPKEPEEPEGPADYENPEELEENIPKTRVKRTRIETVENIDNTERENGDSTAPTEKQKENKETDEQSFKRIYKDLKKKKHLNREDTDKMISLLSEKENYDKLKIRTNRFLIFKSNGEKVFRNLSRELERQINEVRTEMNLTDIYSDKEKGEIDILDTLENAAVLRDSEEERERINGLIGSYKGYNVAKEVRNSVMVDRKQIDEAALPPANVEPNEALKKEDVKKGPPALDELEKYVNEPGVDDLRTKTTDEPNKEAELSL